MKDKSKIPEGDYCYDKSGPCPYYRKMSKRPERLSGFCDFLEKGDMELVEERVKHNWTRRRRDEEEISMSEEEKKIMAKDGCMSLLWDACKECDINKRRGKGYQSESKNESQK